MPGLNQEAYDKRLLEQLTKYSKKTQKAYLQAINLVTNLSSNLPLNANKEFYFKDHPMVQNNVNAVLEQLYKDVYGNIVQGINTGWDLAVEKNNQIAKDIYGADLKDLPKEYRSKYLSNNDVARQNFIKRKDAGLGLSDKVWKNTEQFKQELELALELGLSEGKSAQYIAKQVKQYLNSPDKLWRRVRNKDNGTLRLSKAAKAYHPGQGRYRSSYKNALRLTRNEINFSYEGSQEEKRKQQDFIVGIQIKVSPQHRASDDKGGISCLSLQGRYPKDFKWTYKWHVNCKCMSLNILKSSEELDSDLDRILSGEEPLEYSDNQVLSIPGQYNMIANDKRFSNSRTFANNKDYKERTVEKPKQEGFDLTGFKYANLPKGIQEDYAAFRELQKSYEKEVQSIHLTDKEYENIKFYLGSEYEAIRILNSGKKVKGSLSYIRHVEEINKSIFKTLQKAKAPTDLVLSRRVIKNDDFCNVLRKMKPGEIFTDKSFMSTSIVELDQFGEYTMKIIVSKGQPVLNVDNSLELEYLIQKGSKFKIIKQSENETLMQLL